MTNDEMLKKYRCIFRCKECNNSGEVDGEFNEVFCHEFGCFVPEKGFCWMGESKEDFDKERCCHCIFWTPSDQEPNYGVCTIIKVETGKAVKTHALSNCDNFHKCESSSK